MYLAISYYKASVAVYYKLVEGLCYTVGMQLSNNDYLFVILNAVKNLWFEQSDPSLSLRMTVIEDC